jgi:hypothetical protein
LNTSGLSDYQLYQLSKNYKLDKGIRIAADEEIKKRNLSEEYLQKISIIKETNADNKPVQIPNKYLLMLFPFTWIVHVIVSKKFPAEKDKIKQNEYWIFFMVGCVAWAFIIILLSGIFIVQQP